MRFRNMVVRILPGSRKILRTMCCQAGTVYFDGEKRGIYIWKIYPCKRIIFRVEPQEILIAEVIILRYSPMRTLGDRRKLSQMPSQRKRDRILRSQRKRKRERSAKRLRKMDK